MTTADVSLVAKESIVVEKLKNYMPAQFFCPTLYLEEVEVVLVLASLLLLVFYLIKINRNTCSL